MVVVVVAPAAVDDDVDHHHSTLLAVTLYQSLVMAFPPTLRPLALPFFSAPPSSS